MKKVIIIGGGFLGSKLAKDLESSFEVTLIDTKEYFEFTPAILRSIVDPSILKNIQILHEHYLQKAKIIKGKVTEITEDAVKVNEQYYLYDYLVLAMGSSYQQPIKNQEVILPSRALTLKHHYEQVKNAATIAVIGAGPVGLELAAEIKDAYHQKKVLLLDSKAMPLSRFPETVQKLALTWITRKGIHFYPNTYFLDYKDKKIITKTAIYDAEIVFFCLGIKPNTQPLQEHFAQQINEKGFVNVDQYLRVKGTTNIFAGGDLIALPEEKLAQTALAHAKIIKENILRSIAKKPLKTYIPKPRPMLISLGKTKAIFFYKTIAFKGYLPALAKNLLPWWEMRKLL